MAAALFTGCSSEVQPAETSNPQSTRASGAPGEQGSMSAGPADAVMNPDARPSMPERRVQSEGAPQAAAPTAGVESVMPRPAPTAPTPNTSDDPSIARFAGFSAPKPAAWQYRAPSGTSGMRVAEYGVPGIDGAEQANIIVYQFPGGGSFAANVERWKGQFRSADGAAPVEAKLETLDADGIRVEVAELSGAYRGMNSPDFATDHTLIAAMIETDGNPVFIQLVGPTRTIDANRDAYMAMLRGIRRNEPMK